MLAFDEAIPTLSETLVPPTIRGTADLTTFAYQGNGYEALLERIGPEIDSAAYLYDSIPRLPTRVPSSGRDVAAERCVGGGSDLPGPERHSRGRCGCWLWSARAT